MIEVAQHVLAGWLRPCIAGLAYLCMQLVLLGGTRRSFVLVVIRSLASFLFLTLHQISM